jgi:hypothetical protein
MRPHLQLCRIAAWGIVFQRKIRPSSFGIPSIEQMATMLLIHTIFPKEAPTDCRARIVVGSSPRFLAIEN